MRPFFLVTALVASQSALADCGQYTAESVVEDMTQAEAGLAAGEVQQLVGATDRMSSGLPCASEVLQPWLVARAFRVMAAGALAAEDEGQARGWYTTAIEVDAGFDYGVEELALDHPARVLYAELKLGYQPEPSPVEDRVFPDGKHYLDGRMLEVPQAVEGRTHLYQWERESSVQSWVISGSSFPKDVLIEPGAEVADTERPPRTGNERHVALPGCAWLRRDMQTCRPAEKSPLLAAGLTIAVSSGALYGVSGALNQRFHDAGTIEEVQRYRGATNRMVILSGAALAVSAVGLSVGVAI